MPFARYSESGIKEFGETAYTADPQQLINRYFTGFTGHGAYESTPGTFFKGDTQYFRPSKNTATAGDGAFWNSLWNGVKSVAHTLAPIGKAALTAGIQTGLPMLVKAIGEGAYVMPRGRDAARAQPGCRPGRRERTVTLRC